MRIDEIIDSGGDWPEHPQSPWADRMKWKMGGGKIPPPRKIKVSMPGQDRFDLQRPHPADMPTEMSQQDLDALIARIKAEEELPPHKKNAARIQTLKKQAMDMMRKLDLEWVQVHADRMLPRLNERRD